MAATFGAAQLTERQTGNRKG